MSERRVRTLDAPARFVTKDMVMCVVVLAVIALVAGVLLGLVNWLTYVDPGSPATPDRWRPEDSA